MCWGFVPPCRWLCSWPTISIISAAGIAIGCASLVIILSIYNGFDTLVKELYDSTSPDLLITPAKGKTFSAEGEAFSQLRSLRRAVPFAYRGFALLIALRASGWRSTRPSRRTPPRHRHEDIPMGWLRGALRGVARPGRA